MSLIPLFTNIEWILSFTFTIYISYYAIMFFFSFKSIEKRVEYDPKNKFAVIIAARNEEQVIGNLVESLKGQNYPKDMYNIIVVPNNCTDNTGEVALSYGATVINCTLPVKSKGEVLTFVFDKIFESDDRYDAFCVVDADNLVHPDFLSEMNNALCSGAKIAQGYRDSKNPYDTIISSCYSIYYWMVNRLHNHARSAVGLSAMVNGSGFMVSAEVLREMNGWHTVTITEDIEFTTQCVLKGHKVKWVPEAIVYDEQPLTFGQSWKQRKRWSTGILQGLETYMTRLIKCTLKTKSLCCVDLMMFFVAPVMQVLYFITLLLGITLNVLYINYHLFPQNEIYSKFFMSADYSYFTSVLIAIIVIFVEKKGALKIFKGVISYWVFIMSWIPINIVCLLKRNTQWHEIKHTRSLTLIELSADMQGKKRVLQKSKGNWR